MNAPVINITSGRQPREHFVNMPTLHEDQVRLYWTWRDHRERDVQRPISERRAWAHNAGRRLKTVRCGRRYGKTTFGRVWMDDGVVQGLRCGWFAPNYKYLDEAFNDLRDDLEPITRSSSRTKRLLRAKTRGLLECWSLEDDRAGRSRFYDRIFIDEGGYAPKHTMKTWQTAIKPTLLDTGGECIVASNTNGVDEENFLWQICNMPEHGFVEYHAPTWANPLIPLRFTHESEEDYAARRVALFADMQAREHPMVWLQEYAAEFVDWSGVAFFAFDKWLVDGKPVAVPPKCDTVFAIIDTAVKAGQEHDGTAVIYFARNRFGGHPLVILDWDIVQIEGDTLRHWLPSVLTNLNAWAERCGARRGVAGGWIEDKSSGTILLQHAQKNKMPFQAIESDLTAMGKDERAISISTYHHQGMIKITDEALDRRINFKTATRNHLVSQVTSFRIGDKEAAKRADDLLDCYCYGAAIALGNSNAI